MVDHSDRDERKSPKPYTHPAVSPGWGSFRRHLAETVRLVGSPNGRALLLNPDGAKKIGGGLESIETAVNLATTAGQAFAVVVRKGLLVVDADSDEDAHVDLVIAVLEEHGLGYVHVRSSPGRSHIYIPVFGIEEDAVEWLANGLRRIGFDGVLVGDGGRRIRPPYSPHPFHPAPALPIAPRDPSAVASALRTAPDPTALAAVAGQLGPKPSVSQRQRSRQESVRVATSSRKPSRLTELPEAYEMILNGDWRACGASSRSEALFRATWSALHRGWKVNTWMRHIGLRDAREPRPLIAQMLAGGQENRSGSSRDPAWFETDFGRIEAFFMRVDHPSRDANEVTFAAAEIATHLSPTTVDARWWRTSGLAVLQTVVWIVGQAGRWDVSLPVRPLAEQAGVSRWTARDRLQDLRHLGVLTRLKKARGGNGAVYRIERRHPLLAPSSSASNNERLALTRATLDHDAWRTGGLGKSAYALWTVLTAAGSPAKDIAEKHGTSPSWTRELLRRLEAAGLAERDGHSLWSARGLTKDETLDRLGRAAGLTGTKGTGETQREDHATERANYQSWLQAQSPRKKRPTRHIVDPDTGEILDGNDLLTEPPSAA